MLAQQSICRLESHKAAAEHQGVADLGQRLQHLPDLGCGPHVEDVFEIRALSLYGAGVCAGGDKKTVIGIGGSVRGGNGSPVHIHGGDPCAEHGGDVIFFVKIIAADRQFVGIDAAFEKHADHGAAVRGEGLIRNQRDLALRIIAPDGFNGTDTGNSISHDNVFHDSLEWPFRA